MDNNILFILITTIAIIIAYLFGSINFAIIVTKIMIGKDIRSFGSGNAGMTNVLRTVGKKGAAITLLGDISKGIISVLIARLLFYFILGNTDFALGEYLVAFAALLGHLFPIFYKFKGGKGILVSSGAMLILAPFAFLIALAVFIVVAVISKYVSLGSIICAIAFAVANYFILYFTNSPNLLVETIFSALIAVSIIFMHRSNIVRLIKGEENKVGQKKK